MTVGADGVLKHSFIDVAVTLSGWQSVVGRGVLIAECIKDAQGGACHN